METGEPGAHTEGAPSRVPAELNPDPGLATTPPPLTGGTPALGPLPPRSPAIHTTVQVTSL